MAKYNDSKCRLCRREGSKLMLKGDRCFTDKCAFDRRPYAPGQHGRTRKKASDYALQLREKEGFGTTLQQIQDELQAFAAILETQAERSEGLEKCWQRVGQPMRKPCRLAGLPAIWWAGLNLTDCWRLKICLLVGQL